MDWNAKALELAENSADRAARLAQYTSTDALPLARALKTVFDTSRTSNLSQALSAAEVLTALAAGVDEPEVWALAAWTAGMAAAVQGQMESAIESLNTAEARFLALGQAHTAASTQVSKLFALAVLGRYAEAEACGLRIRAVFEAEGDLIAAGKVEQNLGGLYLRREQYPEAERLLRSARRRYAAVGENELLAQVENNLANVMAGQHRFGEAMDLYAQALVRAEASQMTVTQAEIECNLGCLALYQGRFDEALDYLERSRRRYEALGMPHESAIAEQELADAYLELGLAPEAAAIYERVTPLLASLGMQAEQARALAYSGRALLRLGQMEEANERLAAARTLYEAEGNSVGAALTRLTEAQVAYSRGDYATAAAQAAEADAPLTGGHVWRWALLARWLRGEALRALGRTEAAQAVLEATLRDTQRQQTPQVTYYCYTSLGLLALQRGETARAEAALRQAVALTEEMRATLPAEEFRTAFVADKLTPYAELVRLCLADQTSERAIEALEYVERAKSRALMDMLGGALPVVPHPRDAYEAEIWAQVQTLREELNWFYSQINRPPDAPDARLGGAMETLHAAARERETQILALHRQLQQGGTASGGMETLEIGPLQRDLGDDTALVEYFSLDGQLLAFLATQDGLEVIRGLGAEAEVEAMLAQLRFQLETLRHGAVRLQSYLSQLTERIGYYLKRLYDLLLRPIETRLMGQRLLVVPYRALHYVPFHALHDGVGYVIERRAVSYAPSASVLHHLLTRPAVSLDRAVLLGVPTPHTPRVRDEVLSLASLFSQSTTLLDGEATLAALQRHAPSADILHLACHGQFRAEQPLFSLLRLSDSWLTVRDAYRLKLNCGLVSLSACETGVSGLAPGDELIGLARGFFAAGAPSLLVSLWTADDEVTARLMLLFYRYVLDGVGPSAALRQAQLDLLPDYPHPYFWSPFVLLGRW